MTQAVRILVRDGPVVGASKWDRVNGYLPLPRNDASMKVIAPDAEFRILCISHEYVPSVIDESHESYSFPLCSSFHQLHG